LYLTLAYANISEYTSYAIPEEYVILRIDCPICKKDSYSSSVVDFRPCPYCGIAFSGKYGIEKRNALRTRKEIPFLFDHDNYKSDATTIDLSEEGVGVRISDQVLLPVGDVIVLRVKDSDLKARVRWVNTEGDPPNTIGGFKIVQGRLSLPRG
jgi:hypothetical protein